ncbi:MAG: hypothetical protein O7B99_04940 [Planctomycetota bacterium]|nr:hypothetical protein [Planctomycetota bacterium]
MILLGPALAALLSFAGPPWAGSTGDDRIDALLSELERVETDAWRAGLDELVTLGEEAALRALATMDEAEVGGRRSRAMLVRLAGGARCIAPAIERLVGVEQPDEIVRLELVRFLGRRDLEREGAAERIEALHERARDDLSAEVRVEAIDALARVEDVLAIVRLDGLLDELFGMERAFAARALADLTGRPEARAVVMRRVQQVFAGEDDGRPLDERSLAILLDEYGDVLAQLPGGGELAHERVPLVAGRDHPSPLVRLAALSALDGLVARLTERGDEPRAQAVLAALRRDGLDPLELLDRSAWLALARGDDPARGAAHARAMLARTEGSNAIVDREARARGFFLLAAAEVAGGRNEEARATLARATLVLEGLLAERTDAMPGLGAPANWIPGADRAVVLWHQLALADLWRATSLLAEGAEPSDARLLSVLRRMHRTELEAQLFALQRDASLEVQNLDFLLVDRLGPRQLILSNPDSSAWPPERALELRARLGSAIASVTAYELPGFEPVAGVLEDRSDPLGDPERFTLLLDIQDETRDWLQRQVEEEMRKEERDAEVLARLRLLQLRLAEERRKNQQNGYAALFRRRQPSNLAYDLSRDLRVEGSPVEARELAERMKADLLAEAARGRGEISELRVAQIEFSVGSSYMDERRPDLAEQEFQRAVDRLAAYEETLRERMASVDEPAQRSAYRAIATARSRRADGLLSLAVNANVRMGDPARALAYFEQAFELKQTDFMRVLLACYRARSDREGEARAVLAEVSPAPSLYYNLACTHALLGDADVALDYLQRELQENHASVRSRDRQKEWAREDPDLAPLRGDPRFQRILAPEKGP